MEEIIGHRKIIDYFKLLHKNKRLASLYLFIGKKGIGKKKVAKYVASLINCLNSQPPCFNCPNCLNISKGLSLDIIELNSKNSIGINEIREVQRRIHFKNFSLPYKVVIIDSADKLTAEASSALLKTLEEPPANTLIFLITALPQNIAPTIISRAQKIYFRLSFPQVRELFLKIGISEAESDFFLKIFEGRLSFLKDREFYSEKRNFLKGSFSSLKEEERTSLKEVVFLLMYFLRDCLIFKAGFKDKIINSDLELKIKSYSQKFSLRDLEEKIKELFIIYQSLDNININLANNLIRAVLA